MPRRSAAPRSDVLFLHAKQIEREADLLLGEYAEIIEPVLEPPVPIEELVGTVLQLRHQFLDLRSRFPYADVHGAIWFEEALIGIDSNLNPDSFPRRRGRYHFTLAHEIGHWRLHRDHYITNPAQRRLFDDGTAKPDVVCRFSERKKPVEWQADTFAANLLMPRKLVHAVWPEFRGGDDRAVEVGELHAAHSGSPFFYRGQPAATEEERDNAVKEDFCRPLAERFEVSREAMRIRLEELELIVRERPGTLFQGTAYFFGPGVYRSANADAAAMKGSRMAGTFDPKRVLRQISNHLLRDLFEAHHHELELPWDQLRETEVDPIFAAWQSLSEKDCRAIEIVLHEVNDMAAGDEGIRAISEEALRQGNRELIADLEEFTSRHDKAVWTYIRATDVWNLAVRFARADSLSRGRYWIKRCDIPATEPETIPETVQQLADALSAFFLATQARGRHCQVEHYVRASGADYFFAYLDDYADMYVTLDDAGAFDIRPERRAFELVVVYDRRYGTLEMYVRGGKKVYVPLQEIFCRVILGVEIGPEDRNSHPYELNGVLDRDFQFPTEPVDGIDSVRIRKMRLSIKGLPRRRITLEADPEGGIDDIYDMMDGYLNQHLLPTTILNVTQVGFKFEFDPEREDLPRSLSFELSWPNSSNLKSKPEAARELAGKYLRQWGLDRVATAPNAQPAS